MIFNSIPFIIFFPIVVILYYLCPKKIRYIWLLLCSYFFYMTQSSDFVALLLLTTITTYLAGIAICKVNSITLKKVFIGITFVLNVGIIVYMKYTNFFLEMFGSKERFNLFVPIGISFYTLQALSYIMDCYRGKISPMYNIARYALYVSFFPTLLSGPINRSYDLMPELTCTNKLELDNVKQGMQKMLWGYFLKLVIAARLTILVDTVYQNPDEYSSVSLVLAAISFLFMLYCDFEGYSLIAIGASKILGINMRDNFRQPFYSTSMSELWRRWHISLSTWLREYLYFPLGGNRKGTARKYINTMIVMFVSGIWHGANYTFFVWGILNGLFLVVGSALKDRRDQLATAIGLAERAKLRTVLQRIGVYILYGFSMIFFANDSLAGACSVIRGIVTRISIKSVLTGELFSLGLGTFNLLFVIVLAVFVMVVDGLCNRRQCDITGLMKTTPTYIRWIAYLTIVVLILFSSNLSGTEFIYSKM